MIDAASLRMMNAHKLTFAQPCPVLPSSGDFSLPQVSSEDDQRTSVDQPDHCTDIYSSKVFPSSFGVQVSCLKILQLSIISCWKSGSSVRTSIGKCKTSKLCPQSPTTVQCTCGALAQVQLCSVPVRVRPPLTDRQTITMAKSRLLPPTPLPCPE